MAKLTTWMDRLINRIAPLQSVADYPDQIQRAQGRMDTLDRLADNEPDSLRAAAYRSVWRTMGEELGFVVDDLDRGRLNDEALTTAVEQWENYGRAYLAQNAISADTVFPQPEGAVYDPAGDVALARGAIRAELRHAETSGDQHREAVLRNFDAQLNSMVEMYTLTAADHRAQGRDETPDLDREVFRREMGEHAAYFSGKVHPGAEIALPSDLLPMPSSYHPGFWERHQQLFNATLDWASRVRHPILDSTQYQPPGAASSAVRDHAAAVHAWALAEANQARNAGNTARQDGLHDFADDVVLLLSQYEVRATASPGQDLDQLDRHAFAGALEHIAGLDDLILRGDDAIVLPEQLRAGAYELGDDEYPEDVEARLTLRSHQLFPNLGQPIDPGQGADALIEDAAGGQAHRAEAVAEDDDGDWLSDPASYLTAEQHDRADAIDTPAREHERLAELVSAAERAEMNAERLADADNPAGAARQRAQARQWLKDADGIATSAGLGSLYTDTDADADTVDDVASAADEPPDDEYDAARRQELAAELEAAEYNNPQRRAEKVARQLNEQMATADSAGDAEEAKRLQQLARETRHVPYAWDGESVINPEPWQIEAREEAEVEASAAQEIDDVEIIDQASTKPVTVARGEVEQVGDAAERDDATDDVKEATETSACSVAASRAETVVTRVHERLDSEARRAEQAARDEELARWHADDLAAGAADERAIENTGPVLGDDQQV